MTEAITFADRAAVCRKYGMPCVPLRPQTKVAVFNEWQNKATTDSKVHAQWNKENPEYNCAIVFKSDPKGFWALETDSSETARRYERETGKKLPSTLTVQSRVGRGHRYFKHTPASLAMGNIGQAEAEGFSVRANNAYCVSPLSVHPDTKTLYTVMVDTQPAAAPDDFVAWLAAQKKVKQVAEKSATWMDDDIFEGARDNTLMRIGASLRAKGFGEEEIYAVLAVKNQKQCKTRDGKPNPLADEDVERIAHSVSRYAPGTGTVLLGGSALDGPEADLIQVAAVAATEAVVAAKAQQAAPIDVTKWRDSFRTVGQLESGDVQMLIEGFLPAGTNFIGARSGHGKTLIALSIAKALTTAGPLFGTFPVVGVVPILYLIPESSGRAFRARAEKFGIPDDPELFLCRTISEGKTTLLDDPILKAAVVEMKPLVILDTAIRFTTSSDENAASQNKKLNDDIIELRQLGASVLGIHHATKSSRGEKPDLENTLRGTGDIGAMCDAVYSIRRDDLLYDDGRGPNEIEVVCVKPRDFVPPKPFKIAATVRENGQILSVIDRSGDFLMLEKPSITGDKERIIAEMIMEDPQVSMKTVAQQIRSTEWDARQVAKRLGWKKGKGPGSRWVRLNPEDKHEDEPDEKKPIDVGQSTDF